MIWKKTHELWKINKNQQNAILANIGCRKSTKKLLSSDTFYDKTKNYLILLCEQLEEKPEYQWKVLTCLLLKTIEEFSAESICECVGVFSTSFQVMKPHSDNMELLRIKEKDNKLVKDDFILFGK